MARRKTRPSPSSTSASQGSKLSRAPPTTCLSDTFTVDTPSEVLKDGFTTHNGPRASTSTHDRSASSHTPCSAILYVKSRSGKEPQSAEDASYCGTPQVRLSHALCTKQYSESKGFRDFVTDVVASLRDVNKQVGGPPLRWIDGLSKLAGARSTPDHRIIVTQSHRVFKRWRARVEDQPFVDAYNLFPPEPSDNSPTDSEPGTIDMTRRSSSLLREASHPASNGSQTSRTQHQRASIPTTHVRESEEPFTYRAHLVDPRPDKSEIPRSLRASASNPHLRHELYMSGCSVDPGLETEEEEKEFRDLKVWRNWIASQRRELEKSWSRRG